MNFERFDSFEVENTLSGASAAFPRSEAMPFESHPSLSFAQFPQFSSSSVKSKLKIGVATAKSKHLKF